MAGAIGRGGLARLLRLMTVVASAALLAMGVAASIPSSAWADEAFDTDAVPQVLGDAEVAGDVELFAAQAEVDMVDALAAPIERNYDFAFQVLDLVNEERAAAGVDPLTMDPQLLNAAMNVRAVECSVFSAMRGRMGSSASRRLQISCMARTSPSGSWIPKM